MTIYDKLWDYNDPAATEVKFREALNSLAVEDNSTRLQLLTQLARTQGLRRRFDEACRLLDEVEAALTEENKLVSVRYFLERGRVFNSSGDKRNAEVCFRQALDLAKQTDEDFYAIDAIHMLAIIAAPAEAVGLNEEAILLAEESTQEKAKNWLGSLYNNLAWSYFDKGEYEKALSLFLRALKWREDKQQAHETFLAKWCVARTLRALSRLEDAIKIQLGLLEELVSSDTKDGYVYEELGELYLQKEEPVHKMYFRLAYTELSEDKWLSKNEPARLDRLKELSA
jgi:tetratricopeptide (TPR) repeat protein